jgi:hypothetical protein
MGLHATIQKIQNGLEARLSKLLNQMLHVPNVNTDAQYMLFKKFGKTFKLVC